MKKKLCNASKKCIVNDIETSGRKVKFYYAVFDDLDANGWIFNSKAFNRTINNEKDRPFLREHNNLEVVGKVIELGTDSKGAWAVTKIANTDRGNETLGLYEEGVYKYHSFSGYAIQSTKITNGTLVKEASLEEVSVVLNPANINATIISIENAIRNGTLTLEQLEALVPDEDHNDSPVEESAEDLLTFIKNY